MKSMLLILFPDPGSGCAIGLVVVVGQYIVQEDVGSSVVDSEMALSQSELL